MRSIQRGLLMELYRLGKRETKPGSPDYFTGTVWMAPIIEAPEPARVRALRVHFEPGARTAWHTHPLGQTLYVLSGPGRFQTDGEPVQEIRAGDTIWISPGERHWHGAAPDAAMTHIAIQESLNGNHADWMEHVSDADYSADPSV